MTSFRSVKTNNTFFTLLTSRVMKIQLKNILSVQANINSEHIGNSIFNKPDQHKKPSVQCNVIF